MGSYFSTENTARDAAEQPPTAKVVTLAGALREYFPHVTASVVLAGDQTPCFLCSSDKLFCNDYIPAVDPREPLQPGQLYFVLPAAKLRYPLSGKDMAELVVRASSALAMASENGGKKNKKKKNKKIRIMPVAEAYGGQPGGSSSEELERFDEKEGLVRQSVLPVKRTMRRSGSMKWRVVRPHWSSTETRLSTIHEAW